MYLSFHPPIYIRIYVYLSIYIYVSIFPSTYLYTYICISIDIYIYVSVFPSTCLYTYTCISIDIYICICLSIHLSIYVYMYIYRYIYMYLSFHPPIYIRIQVYTTSKAYLPKTLFSMLRLPGGAGMSNQRLLNRSKFIHLSVYPSTYLYRTPRPCSVCGSPRLCRRRERCLIMARFGCWPLAWRKIWAVSMFDLAV